MLNKLEQFKGVKTSHKKQEVNDEDMENSEKHAGESTSHN